MTKSIVISGPPAVGKTTVAKGLANEFNLIYLSGGDVLKDLAKEQGFEVDFDDSSIAGISLMSTLHEQI